MAPLSLNASTTCSTSAAPRRGAAGRGPASSSRAGPATGGGGQATVSLFKVGPDGREATRVQVKLGRTSVNNVEVVEGLNVGDTVILSDTSQWDGVDRLRLD